MEDNKHPLAHTPEAIAKRAERKAKKTVQFSEGQSCMTTQEKNAQRLLVENMACSLRQRRKIYLADRNLENTLLENQEIEQITEMVNNCKRYNCIFDCQNLSYGYINLFIEMWKYPDKRLNGIITVYLTNDALMGRVSLPLWLNMLSREFVPNDALRFIIKQSDVLIEAGGAYILPRELKHHQVQEIERLKEAERLEEPKRSSQVARVQGRLALFKKAIFVFEA